MNDTTEFASVPLSVLVQDYVEMGLSVASATSLKEHDLANQLTELWGHLGREIRARGPEAIAALMPFMDHPNPLVRIEAAQNCHGLDPDRARRVLEVVSNSGESPYCFLADAKLHLMGYGSRLFGKGKLKTQAISRD